MRIFITHNAVRWGESFLAGFALALFSGLAIAQVNIPAEPLPKVSLISTPASQLSTPTSEIHLKVLSVRPEKATMGEKITVEVEGLSKAIKQGKEKFDPAKLILYFDGYPLEGIYPDSVDSIREVLIFTPVRNEENKNRWTALIGSPKSYFLPVKVSVGFKDQYALPIDEAQQHFQFVVFRQNWFAGGMCALLLMIGLFIWLARTSNIIRDSHPPLPGPGKTKPYSLAKLQASVWFFLVVVSFLFIWLVTGDHTNTVTEQALVLIGIGTGTALGAAMIDANKRDVSDDERAVTHPKESELTAEVQELKAKMASLQAKLTTAPPGSTEDIDSLSKLKIELAQKEAQLSDIRKKIADATSALSKPISEGFVRDLLTDASGISFHRFQMLVWTIILGFIFCVEVYKTLRMPEFSTTLLSLMGISAGTYLGFKIPERSS
jgi:hypothetical protein